MTNNYSKRRRRIGQPSPMDNSKSMISANDRYELSSHETDETTIAEKARMLGQIDTSDPIQEEFVFKNVNRLILRGKTVDEIARIFGVSTSTVTKWRSLINKKKVQELTYRDCTSLVADSVHFFDDIKNTALTEAYNESNNAGDRLRALDVARRTEVDKNNHLERVGVFDNFRLMLEDGGEQHKSYRQAGELQSLTDDFFDNIRQEIAKEDDEDIEDADILEETEKKE